VLKLYAQYKQSELEPQGQVNLLLGADLRKLEAQVHNNHRAKGRLPVFHNYPQLQSIVPRTRMKRLTKAESRDWDELGIAKECRRLYYKEKLCQQQVMS
jgi:hypothetical protein